MFKDGTPYISPKYEKTDYLNLELDVHSSDAEFEKAVDIFKDRIEGRFLAQIDQLSCDCDRNGFAIMALECLLIETLGQFVAGREDNQGCSRSQYTAFLKTQLGISPVLADEFYSKIRCGILHQAQTKAESALTPSMGVPAVYRDCERKYLMVGVNKFIEMMEDYVAFYCDRIKDPAEIELRTNFIRKMDYICKR